VNFIGEKAFHACFALTSASIPTSVTSIGYQAFAHCTSLTCIVIAGSPSMDGTAFEGDPPFFLFPPRSLNSAEVLPFGSWEAWPTNKFKNKIRTKILLSSKASKQPKPDYPIKTLVGGMQH